MDKSLIFLLGENNVKHNIRRKNKECLLNDLPKINIPRKRSKVKALMELCFLTNPEIFLNSKDKYT